MTLQEKSDVLCRAAEAGYFNEIAHRHNRAVVANAAGFWDLLVALAERASELFGLEVDADELSEIIRVEWDPTHSSNKFWLAYHCAYYFSVGENYP